MDARSVAYFSMEIGIAPEIPTYSGGLGVLAGDTLRAAAELGLPMVAVTLLHRQGFFFQSLTPDGWQLESPDKWSVNDILTELPHRVTVPIGEDNVVLRVWEYNIVGIHGHKIPVYFLDADLEVNKRHERDLSGALYAGDSRYRFSQEIILGVGGIRMLKEMAYNSIDRYHLNEGHAALLTFELLSQKIDQKTDKKVTEDDIESVRKRCVFTTHTPVSAGHDKFDFNLVRELLTQHSVLPALESFLHEGLLNMTYLALKLCHYVNGVAKKHGEVSRDLLKAGPGENPYVIDAITNGIHLATWMTDSVKSLMDKYVPLWQKDFQSIRYAKSIPSLELWDVHQNNKLDMIKHLNKQTNSGFDKDVLTIGFARRFTAYKRPVLLFEDLNRLRHLASLYGGIQLVFAGKAHPHDNEGKHLIQRVWQLQAELANEIKLVYLPNYGMADAKKLVAGVDIWLNTPQPPMEASGTSGMKAAANGVPSLSVLDGWWIEGCIEGVTGWAIGTSEDDIHSDQIYKQHATSLYDKLEHQILPMYYEDNESFREIMRNALSLNGSFFNTHRMLQQYVAKAYK